MGRTMEGLGITCRRVWTSSCKKGGTSEIKATEAHIGIWEDHSGAARRLGGLKATSLKEGDSSGSYSTSPFMTSTWGRTGVQRTGRTSELFGSPDNKAW